MNRYFLSILVVLFLVISGIAWGLHAANPSYSFAALMGANGLMFLLSFCSYLIIRKQLLERPQAFVRGVMSATLLKLTICLGAVLAYVLINRPHLYKPTVFVFLGIYALYTIAEKLITGRMAKHVK